MKKDIFLRVNVALIATVLSLTAFSSLVSAQAITAGGDPRKFGSTVELHVMDNGHVKIEGAQIDKIAGSTFYTKIYWGQTSLRITVRTNASTVFTKHYGGTMPLSDVAEGDFISLEGDFYTGSSVLDVTASSVKDWSAQKESDTFTGTISAVTATTPPGFILSRIGQPQVIVMVSPTTQITRGNISSATLAAGDTVLSVIGTFDHLNNTLAADSVKLYQDMSVFAPRNFEGKIVSVSGTSLPVQVVFSTTENGKMKQYTAVIPANASVLNAKRIPASIGRFLVGDSIRIYGAIRETSQMTVDAQIIRNLNL